MRNWQELKADNVNKESKAAHPGRLLKACRRDENQSSLRHA